MIGNAETCVIYSLFGARETKLKVIQSFISPKKLDHAIL